MTCYLPVRKIFLVIWKPAHLNDRREKNRPYSVHDVLDNPSREEGFCRPWLIVILVLALTYYLYRFNTAEEISFVSINEVTTKQVQTTLDIQVVKTVGTNTSCGVGCDMEEVSKITKKNISDIRSTPHVTQPAPTTPTTCEINMLGRGKVKIHTNKLKELHSDHHELIQLGGYYKPKECQSRHKVAILVPYRNRERNLLVFLFNIHPFLIDQKLEYRIFVIEQSGQQKFNKGRLLNAGFEQAQRFGRWHCFVFHDADLLPLDRGIQYSCPIHPRHMSTVVVEFKHIPTYNAHFGGVTAMTGEHFKKVNGYSNMYWGWGGEDFDMFWRIRLAGLPVVRYNREIAEYTMLPHPSTKKNLKRHELISSGFRTMRYKIDGLSTLKYNVVSIKLRALYTHIVVDINPNGEIVE